MIPGVHSAYHRALAGDAAAETWVRASSATARWIVRGEDALVDVTCDAARAQLAVDYGRVSGAYHSFRARVFYGGYRAAVRSDAALGDWIAPLLAAGLFGLPRAARAEGLSTLGPLAAETRRAFESLREALPAPEVCRAATLVLAQMRPAVAVRKQVVSGLSACCGEVWLDELSVLAGAVEIRRVGLVPEVAPALQWWVNR